MDVVHLCSELVKIRSENPPGYTDDVVSFLEGTCDSIGIPTRIIKKGRKWNLLSKECSHNLLLCGHIDVVPALDKDWNYPPFSGFIDDQLVHGRGSTDMKGGCAALIAALAEVRDQGEDPQVDIAFVCDEEGNGDFGMEYLVEGGYLHPKSCLIAEPTPVVSPVIGEKGVLRLHASFSGDAGHASLHPVCGNSAIMQAFRFLDFCGEIHSRTWPEDHLVREVIENTAGSLSSILSISPDEAASILTRVSYNPGLISGGERVNVIAQHCMLDMDMRIPWGCDIDQLIREMELHLAHNTLEVLEKVYPTLSNPGWLYHLISAGIQSVHGQVAKPEVTQAATDARHLRVIGAEVVNYGPGDLNLLHAVNENVPVKMLRDCKNVYAHVLRHLAGPV